MEETLTEKKYPIRNAWLLKQVFVVLIVLAIFIFVIIIIGTGLSSSVLLEFLPFFAVLILALIFSITVNVLKRSYFHYSLDEKFLTLHQGIISKQNRNIPYGVIQGVFIHQTLFDRIFGLASLTMEDFSQGGRSVMNADGYAGYGRSRHEVLGFLGNKVHIPGLKKADAEELKAVILQKVKENPIEDSQSGL